ncbi:MAG: ABC transporter permease [Bradyrhizobiaceae bacterium]|nr:MAG: ABC transporter permease [Bradyrhizobiaceae bacterium]
MNALLAVYCDEFRRIFALKPVWSVLIGAVLIYAAFYPQPYVNEALRNVPIAVVDNDGTASSRELARLIDATPDIHVAMTLPDFVTAEREVYTRRIFGVLVIPQYFERDLLHGRPSPVALYSDASYFLMHQRISAGVTSVSRTFGAQVEATRLVGFGIDPVIASAVTDPLPLTSVPLFNPQGGYATYVLPAAFVLILQQTLLVAVGLLGTLPGAGLSSGESANAGPVTKVVGRLLAYLTVEAVVVPLYLIALPYFYGVPRLGSLAAQLFFAIPFVLSTSALGLVIAAWLRNPLMVQLVLAAIGLPFFFLAGFAWPVEAIPPAVHAVSFLVPSTSAISALVRIGQLGASLHEVQPALWTLWGLTLFYGALAVLIEARATRPQDRPKDRSGTPVPAAAES